MKLTLKQKRFADEYIIGGNATEAAIKAGYSERTANRIATENLSKPVIKAYLEERLKELDDAKIADQKEVMERLTRFSRREENEHIVVMCDKAKFDKDGKFIGIEKHPMVVPIPTPSKDAIKALELLGKRYRIFTDRSEVDEEQLEKLDAILGAIDDAAKS